MGGKLFMKKISTILYGVGVCMVIYLFITACFGSIEVLNPEAMLPTTSRERAAFWLILGTLPMLFAAAMFTKCHHILKRSHKIRKVLLIFTPCIPSVALSIYAVGVLFIGYINMIFR
jgi:hypothetical protein